MPAEKASEFEAGIAGRAEYRGFKFGRHQILFNRLELLLSPILNFLR
jgi:hypothetical protein